MFIRTLRENKLPIIWAMTITLCTYYLMIEEGYRDGKLMDNPKVRKLLIAAIPGYKFLLLLMQAFATSAEVNEIDIKLISQQIFYEKVRSRILVDPELTLTDGLNEAELFLEDFFISMINLNFDVKCHFETLINHSEFTILIGAFEENLSQGYTVAYDYMTQSIRFPLANLLYNLTILSQKLSGEFKTAINSFNNLYHYRCVAISPQGKLVGSNYFHSLGETENDCFEDKRATNKILELIELDINDLFLYYEALIKNQIYLSKFEKIMLNELNDLITLFNYHRVLYSEVAIPDGKDELLFNLMAIFLGNEFETLPVEQNKTLLNHNFSATLHATSFDSQTREMVYTMTNPDESLALDLVLNLIIRLETVMRYYEPAERIGAVSKVLAEVFSPFSDMIKRDAKYTTFQGLLFPRFDKRVRFRNSDPYSMTSIGNTLRKPP